MSEGHGREGNSKLKIKEGSSHEAHSKRKQNIKNDWLRITDPILQHKPDELNKSMKHKIRKLSEVNVLGL